MMICQVCVLLQSIWKFNESVAALKGVDSTLISMDLPFAGKRFCKTEGIENLTVGSDFMYRDFGRKYGVLIAEGPLKGILAKAIFIVNKDGIVAYKQIVPEVTDEPDYNEALNFAKTITG